jgi:hypothetical protein
MLSPDRANSRLAAAPKPLDEPTIKPHGVGLPFSVMIRISPLN